MVDKSCASWCLKVCVLVSESSIIPLFLVVGASGIHKTLLHLFLSLGPGRLLKLPHHN